jgi:hypothetical protein
MGFFGTMAAEREIHHPVRCSVAVFGWRIAEGEIILYQLH